MIHHCYDLFPLFFHHELMMDIKRTTGMSQITAQAIVYSSGQVAGGNQHHNQCYDLQQIHWNHTKYQQYLTQSLADGCSHNVGYHASRWETIIHGNTSKLDRYAVLSWLQEKTARLLYACHDI